MDAALQLSIISAHMDHISPAPSVSAVALERRDPFRILLSTLISLRTRDEVTLAASRRLFTFADTPEALAEADPDEIARLIYPCGFYTVKAERIRKISRIIRDEHRGAVPASFTGLLALPGVGRKTAALTLALGFQIPAVCVDIHVHRISNRLGWVSTHTPEETEYALMELLEQGRWMEVNEALVRFGQIICTPGRPRCSVCPLSDRCPKTGVTSSR